MNVQIHGRNFDIETHANVETISESWGGDQVFLRDINGDEIARFFKHDISYIEVRN